MNGSNVIPFRKPAPKITPQAERRGVSPAADSDYPCVICPELGTCKTLCADAYDGWVRRRDRGEA